MAEIRESGYGCLAYTVNDAGRAIELFGWGVNAVFSDVPQVILAAIAGCMCQSAAAAVNRAGSIRRGSLG